MAYSNLGSKSYNPTAFPVTIDWSDDGAYASYISVYNPEGASADVTITLNPNRGDEGIPLHAPPGGTVTIGPITFCGFTLAGGTAAQTVHIWWW